MKIKKNTLITGTIILTATGLVSRLIGFFYRIFMSRMFGEENMGIYQLIGPVTALVFSLSAAGIQNAISKFVAGESVTHDYKTSLRILLVGFTFSAVLSILCLFVVYSNSEFIAAKLLFEPRCAPLLRIAALSFPFSCVHCCINGYFYGVRKTGVPAATQLTEQLFRVGSVFLIAGWAQRQGRTPTIAVAVIGLVIGEISSLLISLPAAYLHFVRKANLSASLSASSIREKYARVHTSLRNWRSIGWQITAFSAPLTANRLCLNVLQAIESACIPAKMQVYGYSNSQSLSVYGVLTGMAMPLLFFPGAITNSISVLLMPAISEADAANNQSAIRKAVRKCLVFCLLMGCGCMAVFLTFGSFMGTRIFNSSLAGHFIMVLSFMCPTLYLNTTLTSILHGLGKTSYTFFLNMAGLLFRLLFVFFAIPVMGINGYLAGVLISQLFTTIFNLVPLRRYLK